MKFDTKGFQKNEEILTTKISKALESSNLHSGEVEEGLRETPLTRAHDNRSFCGTLTA
ncbi:MAG: hypothetical protein L3J16_05410 [Anaerolineales bacterium]|nr:hypothetical protein [Anaerolineales bacterium]